MSKLDKADKPNRTPNSATSVNGIGSDKGITAKQFLFVTEYLKEPNGKEAAIKAGYATPEIAASKLLNGVDFPKVAAAVKEGLAEKRRESGIEVLKIVQELAKVGFLNVKKLFNKEGDLLAIHELPDEVAAGIKEFKVSQRVGLGAKGEAIKIRTVEVKLHDKLNALQQLSYHLGKLVDIKREEQEALAGGVTFDWSTLHKRREVIDVVEDLIAVEEGRGKAPPTMLEHKTNLPADEDM